MYTLFVIIHVFVSVMLIMIVLLQTGKGAGMGAAFGGGTQTMFGGRGPTTFVHKLTTIMAVLFLVLSITLASMSSKSSSDLEEDQQPPPGKEAGMLPEGEGAGEGDKANKDKVQEDEAAMSSDPEEKPTEAKTE